MNRTLLGVALMMPAVVVVGAAEQQAEQVDFARDVRPIFQDHCISCHGPQKQEAGLRLDVRSAALQGGDSGRVIVSGEFGNPFRLDPPPQQPGNSLSRNTSSLVYLLFHPRMRQMLRVRP